MHNKYPFTNSQSERQQSPQPQMEFLVMELSGLINAGKRDWQIIKNDMSRISRDVKELKESHQKLTARVLQIEDWSRRSFSQSTIKVFIAVCRKYFNGMCPCCGEIEILSGPGKNKKCEIDHFKGPKWNKVTEGWPICSSCHDNLTHGAWARDGGWVEQAFKSFQMRIRQYQEQKDPQRRIF